MHEQMRTMIILHDQSMSIDNVFYNFMTVSSTLSESLCKSPEYTASMDVADLLATPKSWPQGEIWIVTKNALLTQQLTHRKGRESQSLGI